MTDKALIKLTLSFRKGILGKRDSTSMCFAICAPLQSYLGIITHMHYKLVHGSAVHYPDPRLSAEFEPDFVEHYWLQLPDGRILDPTADQFAAPDGSPMPIVYLGERPEWYREGSAK